MLLTAVVLFSGENIRKARVRLHEFSRVSDVITIARKKSITGENFQLKLVLNEEKDESVLLDETIPILNQNIVNKFVELGKPLIFKMERLSTEFKKVWISNVSGGNGICLILPKMANALMVKYAVQSRNDLPIESQQLFDSRFEEVENDVLIENVNSNEKMPLHLEIKEIGTETPGEVASIENSPKKIYVACDELRHLTGWYKLKEHFVNGHLAYTQIPQLDSVENFILPGRKLVIWHVKNKNVWMISRENQINSDLAYAFAHSDKIHPHKIEHRKWKIYDKECGHFMNNITFTMLQTPPPLPAILTKNKKQQKKIIYNTTPKHVPFQTGDPQEKTMPEINLTSPASSSPSISDEKLNSFSSQNSPSRCRILSAPILIKPLPPPLPPRTPNLCTSKSDVYRKRQKLPPFPPQPRLLRSQSDFPYMSNEIRKKDRNKNLPPHPPSPRFGRSKSEKIQSNNNKYNNNNNNARIRTTAHIYNNNNAAAISQQVMNKFKTIPAKQQLHKEEITISSSLHNSYSSYSSDLASSKSTSPTESDLAMKSPLREREDSFLVQHPASFNDEAYFDAIFNEADNITKIIEKKSSKLTTDREISRKWVQQQQKNLFDLEQKHLSLQENSGKNKKHTQSIGNIPSFPVSPYYL